LFINLTNIFPIRDPYNDPYNEWVKRALGLIAKLSQNLTARPVIFVTTGHRPATVTTSLHALNILKSLNIYNFHELYISSKLSFLETIKNNELSMRIFDILCRELDRTYKKSQSFSKDILLLQSHFGIDIELIFAGPSILKRSMKLTFKERDGLTDSITLCLANIKKSPYNEILNNLTKPEFLIEYEIQLKSIIMS
jgi:hypothetical protein